MKKILCTILLGFLFISSTLSRQVFATNANIALRSDYVFRGVSQTGAKPAIQGGLDWSDNANVYLGFWGSNVKRPNLREHLELDAYGGYRYKFAHKMESSIGVKHYGYFSGAEANTVEFPFTFKVSGVKLGYAFSLDWKGTSGFAGYVSAGWETPLPFELTGHIKAGYSHFAKKVNTSEYADLYVGLSREFLEAVFEVAGTAVSRKQFTTVDGGIDDARLIVSVSKEY